MAEKRISRRAFPGDFCCIDYNYSSANQTDLDYFVLLSLNKMKKYFINRIKFSIQSYKFAYKIILISLPLK
jgi:hypothetical protein